MVLITFNNVNDAFKAENLVEKTNDITGYMMSVPQSIRAGCGFALRVDTEDMVLIHTCLKDIPHQLYEMVADTKNTYIPINL